MIARMLRWAALSAALAVVVGPTAYYAYSRLTGFNLASKNLFLAEPNKLALSPLGQMRLLATHRWTAPERVRVLTLRQAEFGFYSPVRFISDIDPRLVDFYTAATIEQAVEVLRRLGITHVVLPNYPTPSFYNSYLQEIVSRPDLSSEIADYNGYRLFQLRLAETDAVAEPRTRAAKPLGGGWTAWRADVAYAVPPEVLSRGPDGTVIRSDPWLSGSAPEVRLISGRGPVALSPSAAFDEDRVSVWLGQRYRLQAQLTGSGQVRLEVRLYVEGEPPHVMPIWDGFLSPHTRTISAAFDAVVPARRCVSCESAELRVVLRLMTRGEVRVGEVRLADIGTAVGSAAAKRAAAIRRGWSLLAAYPEIINWGIEPADGGPLFLRHVGAAQIALESRPMFVSALAPSVRLTLQVRGQGKIGIELRCARDERPGAAGVPDANRVLLRTLDPRVPRQSIDVARRPAPDGGALDRYELFALPDRWSTIATDLRIPACAPLAPDALVYNREVLPPSATADLAWLELSALRVALVTERDPAFEGRAEEFPEFEVRSLQLEVPIRGNERWRVDL